MFKILKNELYDVFQCTTKDCPANCCDEDWIIIIDEEAYQRISALGSADIDSRITKEEPHIIIKKDHKCPFITPEGLCTIHAKYGPDYLSNTCKSYPRFVSGYGDVYTMTLGMSCPEVARLVMELDRPVKFVEEYHYEDPSEAGRRDIFLPSERILEKLFVFLDGSAGITDALTQMTQVVGSDLSLDVLPLPDLMESFRQAALTVSEESLLINLDEMKDLLTVNRLNSVRQTLETRFPFLPINIVRNYLFERIFYHEKDSSISYAHILAQSGLELILFIGVLTVNGFNSRTPDHDITEYLYRTMRVADHSESVLAGIMNQIHS